MKETYKSLSNLGTVSYSPSLLSKPVLSGGIEAEYLDLSGVPKEFLFECMEEKGIFGWQNH